MSEEEPLAYIKQSVQKVILEKKSLIDANRVPASVHAVYPAHAVTRLTEMVIAEAVRVNGNVSWGTH